MELVALTFLVAVIVLCFTAYRILNIMRETHQKDLDRLFLMFQSKNPAEYSFNRDRLEKIDRSKESPPQVPAQGKKDVVHPSMEDRLAQEVMELIQCGMSPDDAVKQVKKKYKALELPLSPVGGDDLEEGFF